VRTIDGQLWAIQHAVDLPSQGPGVYPGAGQGHASHGSQIQLLEGEGVTELANLLAQVRDQRAKAEAAGMAGAADFMARIEAYLSLCPDWQPMDTAPIAEPRQVAGKNGSVRTLAPDPIWVWTWRRDGYMTRACKSAREPRWIPYPVNGAGPDMWAPLFPHPPINFSL
jgi:hypothetical protein